MKENVVSDLVCWGGDIQIDEHVQREIMNHRSLKHSNIIKFKEDSLTQLISSSPRHYRVAICSLPIQGRCSPALAISAFVSASAGTVSLPTSLFAAGIDDNILAKAIKTNVATIQALKSSFAPTS